MTGTKINKQKVDVSHGNCFRYSTGYLFFIIPKSICILIITILQKNKINSLTVASFSANFCKAAVSALKINRTASVNLDILTPLVVSRKHNVFRAKLATRGAGMFGVLNAMTHLAVENRYNDRTI